MNRRRRGEGGEGEEDQNGDLDEETPSKRRRRQSLSKAQMRTEVRTTGPAARLTLTSVSTDGYARKRSWLL